MSTLSAEGLRLTLGGRAILNGIDATLARGQVTAVLGPNGAGKSTLLNCLAGLRKPDAGTVRLDGGAVAAIPPKIRARRIGFLPQTPEIAWALEARVLIGLGRTPYAGVGGLTAEDEAAIDRAVAAADVAPLLGRMVNTLSGGERGRVLIARALAGEPEWLLADEPLAGLDPGHQMDACDLFRRMAHEEGRGVVLTLHDLPMAFRVADRVLMLADGALVADGPPTEALSMEVMRRAYGVEARQLAGTAGPILELIGRDGA